MLNNPYFIIFQVSIMMNLFFIPAKSEISNPHHSSWEIYRMILPVSHSHTHFHLVINLRPSETCTRLPLPSLRSGICRGPNHQLYFICLANLCWWRNNLKTRISLYNSSLTNHIYGGNSHEWM